jgi:hypothetical protein
MQNIAGVTNDSESSVMDRLPSEMSSPAYPLISGGVVKILTKEGEMQRQEQQHLQEQKHDSRQHSHQEQQHPQEQKHDPRQHSHQLQQHPHKQKHDPRQLSHRKQQERQHDPDMREHSLQEQDNPQEHELRVPSWVGDPEEDLAVLFTARAEQDLEGVEVAQFTWLKNRIELRAAIRQALFYFWN